MLFHVFDFFYFGGISFKFLSQRMSESVYKTFGTSVIYSLMLPPSMLILELLPRLQMQFKTKQTAVDQIDLSYR